MKTLLTRMKTALQDSSTLDYFQEVRIVSPRALPLLSQDNLPFIGIAPLNAPEEYRSTGKKDDIMTVEAYLVQWYELEEYQLIGDDEENQKGLLDFVADFKSVVRNNFFPSTAGDADTNYLTRPTEVISVAYSTEPYGDEIGAYVSVATVTLLCPRLFTV